MGSPSDIVPVPPPRFGPDHPRWVSRIERPCSVCGVTFIVMETSVKRFCSPRCQHIFQRGPNHPMFGRRYSLDERRTISRLTAQAMKRVPRAALQTNLGGRLGNPMARPEVRERVTAAAKKTRSTPEYRASVSGRNNAFYGHHHTTNTRQVISKKQKERYRDHPELRRLASLAGAKGFAHRGHRPTNIEARVNRVIEGFNLPFRYTGDGRFQIGSHNPDFTDCNGAKALIEVAGDYWHTPTSMGQRIEGYSEYGFRTLVLWERDLKIMSDEQVADRIRAFV